MSASSTAVVSDRPTTSTPKRDLQPLDHEDVRRRYASIEPPFGPLGYFTYKRCVDVSTPVLCDDLQWRPAGDLKKGQGIIGFDAEAEGQFRHVRAGRVMHNKVEKAETVGIALEDGTVLYATPDHEWLVKLSDSDNRIYWKKSEDLGGTHKNGAVHLLRPFGPVWGQDQTFEGGFLSAAFDGEGCFDRLNSLSFIQVDNAMLRQVEGFLDRRRVPFKRSPKAEVEGRQQCFNVRVNGRRNFIPLLGSLRPPRLLEVFKRNVAKVGGDMGAMRCDHEDYVKVVRVFPAGEREIAVLSTDIETHFTAGFASHNTYAREVPGEGRTEEWWETILRCVNAYIAMGAIRTADDADALYDAMFHMRIMPPGRGLWQLGTRLNNDDFSSLNNCFGGEVEVLTRSGVKTLQECAEAGKAELRVMTESGPEWQKVPVKSFGRQKLLRVFLGDGSFIRATADHQWVPHNSGKIQLDRRKTTTEFRNNEPLPLVLDDVPFEWNEETTAAYAHGFVFGDGCLEGKDATPKRAGTAHVRMFGAKTAMVSILKNFGEIGYFTYKGEKLPSAYCLPASWKSLPENPSPNYALGFILGLITADGHVRSEIRIHNKSEDVLEEIQRMARHAGLRAHKPYLDRELSPFDGTEKPCYALGISTWNMNPDWFVRDDQQAGLGITRRPKTTTVTEVVDLGDEDEVFCAQVPEYRNFVLANGVLTGNCWAVPCSEPEAFCFIFDQLMLGGGVGFNIQRDVVAKLPTVKEGVSIDHVWGKDVEFSVGDTREGWVMLLRNLLSSFFYTGVSFKYSTMLVRPKGEKIKGFGGTSSGPEILVSGMKQISTILQRAAGRKLKTVEALDIATTIGEVVVAGNVRRSAMIAIGDAQDLDYLRAKRWDLGKVPVNRSRSNNSIVVNSGDEFDLVPDELWESFSEKGEPIGFFNLNASRKYGRTGEERADALVICLNPCQPASATLLTPGGMSTIGAVRVGDTIWSGKQWTKVTKKRSSGVKKIHKYHTRAGVFEGTENHRIVSGGEKIEVGQAESIDRVSGQFDDGFISAIPSPDLVDIVDGLLLGDGSVHKASNDLIHLYIGKDDQDYHESEIAGLIGDHRPGIKEGVWEVVEKTLSASELPKTYLRSIPDRFRFGTPEKVRGLLRGLYSANGSVVGGRRVTLKAASLDVILQAQEMLSSLGIGSYYTVNKAHTVEFDNGEYECRESYDLNISTDRGKFRRLIGFLQVHKNERLDEACKVGFGKAKTTYEIVATEFVGEEEVFDITVEAEEHTYWTGGLLVSNCGEITLAPYEPCNLIQLVLPNIGSQKEMFELARLAYRCAKHIAAGPYAWRRTADIIKKNMRLGISVTGIWQKTPANEWLSETYEMLDAYDRYYSGENGWPRSVKLTTVQPDGTKSLLSGVTPGAHPFHADYVIRRIQCSTSNPLVEACNQAGHHVEPMLDCIGEIDGQLQHVKSDRTSVIEFPLKKPEGARTYENVTAIEQLEMLAWLHEVWADNSVSITVNYRDDELPGIRKWLKENWHRCKTVSFLRHFEHGFKQAPFETVTKEKYEEVSKSVRPLHRFKAVTEPDYMVEVDNNSAMAIGAHGETHLDSGQCGPAG